MSPYLPSALGASEVPLIEMVSAYSVFPNKGIRVQPHLIRKVLDRDGKVLEEWEKTTYKVTSEYVAGSMVEMMQGVVKAGGTAPQANAAGHPLAGKTGTVNDQTDVWFIGYTPTYVTGVWMGNPLRKESLGAGMTGGRGALPFFNEFMSQFMKDKPKDKFYETPPMPSDIKALVEQRKREEMEKLEKAEEAGRALGVNYNPPPIRITKSRTTNVRGGEDSVNNSGLSTPIDTSKPDTDLPPPVIRTNPDEKPKTTVIKPTTDTPVKKPDVPADKPKTEGDKRKGKKGDDEP
jgi:penicillin-binding protein 1A